MENLKKHMFFKPDPTSGKLITAGHRDRPDIRSLYAGPHQTAGFIKPNCAGSVSYISDPKKPVPYRTLPIEATYGPGSRWRPWQVEDQRFVYTRPDVISFTTESLKEDLVVTGEVNAHLFASTTGHGCRLDCKTDRCISGLGFSKFQDERLSVSGYHGSFPG